MKDLQKVNELYNYYSHNVVTKNLGANLFCQFRVDVVKKLKNPKTFFLIFGTFLRVCVFVESPPPSPPIFTYDLVLRIKI